MRRLLFVLQKEFRQIFRDPIIMALITIMPVGQLILLPLAADYEVRNIYLAVVDHDQSVESRSFVEQIAASNYFRLVDYGTSYDEAMHLIERNDADIILEIPSGFDRDRVRTGSASLLLAVNAVNGVKANLGASYLQRVIMEHYAQPRSPVIELRSQNRFNVHLDYRRYMVPGILAMLVSMVAIYWAALNIVREIEVGTIEQINVTPIAKWQFILGKLIPFLALALFFFTVGLILGWALYDIVPAGSLPLLYLFAVIYISSALGLGLLISTLAKTQQQAMFVSFFFMLIFIMMSGLFTPIESMPRWAQIVTLFNPVRYLIDVMRLVVLKGSGLAEVSTHLIVITVMALITNTAAVISYRKTS
ncbi:MAG: ABC transporter permease [Ignavibacteriae bacterium]|nr:MAG: ABC transporter permease [Ignavibacteriota bacterium]